MAEQWARENNLKFPPINAKEQLQKDGIKEYYVFTDLADPTCPVVVHFPLVNKTFKEQSKPGFCGDLIHFYVQISDLSQVSKLLKLLLPSPRKLKSLHQLHQQSMAAK